LVQMINLLHRQVDAPFILFMAYHLNIHTFIYYRSMARHYARKPVALQQHLLTNRQSS
jgi:hypothetical protein